MSVETPLWDTDSPVMKENAHIRHSPPRVRRGQGLKNISWHGSIGDDEVLRQLIRDLQMPGGAAHADETRSSFTLSTAPSKAASLQDDFQQSQGIAHLHAPNYASSATTLSPIAWLEHNMNGKNPVDKEPQPQHWTPPPGSETFDDSLPGDASPAAMAVEDAPTAIASWLYSHSEGYEDFVDDASLCVPAASYPYLTNAFPAYDASLPLPHRTQSRRFFLAWAKHVAQCSAYRKVLHQWRLWTAAAKMRREAKWMAAECFARRVCGNAVRRWRAIAKNKRCAAKLKEVRPSLSVPSCLKPSLHCRTCMGPLCRNVI